MMHLNIFPMAVAKVLELGINNKTSQCSGQLRYSCHSLDTVMIFFSFSSSSYNILTILAPGDYTAVTVVLTFTSMESRVCYNVSIGNDIVYEGLEDFEVELRSNDNLINLSPDTALITIVDDDGNNLLLVTIFIIMHTNLRYVHTYRPFN